ncbi:MAG: GTP cyclohydrolase I FolE [Candidatus Latescibacteria bacterium]|nr:GTP cyclohydrolase I FolE [Candidatus Latescibacterota bacterium]
MARSRREPDDPDDRQRSRGQKAYWAKVDQIAGYFSQIMDVLGLPREDPHLKDTPDRVGRMYLEIFRGLEEEREPVFTTFPNAEKYSNMVIVKDIEFYSVCAHHMIPFFGRAHIAYIPDQRIVGLSKIPRVVDFYAHRPQLQERLTEQIIDLLVEKLEPQGAIVVMEARHLCMEMRGVEKPGAYTTTSAIRGCFEDKVVREEFLDLLIKDSKDR